MTEERKHAILFAATILAARKLNDIGNTPWQNECAIKDAIEKARILEKIDEKWPATEPWFTWPVDGPENFAFAATTTITRVRAV